jgi:hypothetical protein
MTNTKKQGFIGELIFTTALETLAGAAVKQVTKAEAPSVARQVANDLAPVIEFKTNNEPWYQSYVTLGSFGGILGSLGVIVSMIAEPSTFEPQLFGGAVAGIAGPLLALWGRWKAKRPIGA